MLIRRSPLRLLACCFLLSLLVQSGAGAQSEAQQALNQALSQAEQTDRLVFLHSGAPWCGWCSRYREVPQDRSGESISHGASGKARSALRLRKQDARGVLSRVLFSPI